MPTPYFLEINIMDEIIEPKEYKKNVLAMLNDWLPKRVIDTHVHSWPNYGHESIMNTNARSPGLTFNYFPCDIHNRFLEKAFPGVDYSIVAMGHPEHPYDKKDNEYILRNSEVDKRIIPIMMAISDKNPEFIASNIAKGFKGLKMYPTYDQKKSTTGILEVWPLSVFELSEKLGTPMIMHLPNGLLANGNELIDLARHYQNAKLIAAHMGVSYGYRSEIPCIFNKVAEVQNIYMDTAMVSDINVLEQGIKIFGPNKILFATDAPFSYVRGGYQLNAQGAVRLRTQVRYPWVDDKEYESYKNEVDRYMFAHINIILAIKQALENLGIANDKKVKEAIFYKNAKDLFCRE